MEPAQTWKITKAEYRFLKACTLAGVQNLEDIDLQQRLAHAARRHRLPIDVGDIAYFMRQFAVRCAGAPLPHCDSLDALERHWLPMIAKEV